VPSLGPKEPSPSPRSTRATVSKDLGPGQTPVSLMEIENLEASAGSRARHRSRALCEASTRAEEHWRLQDHEASHVLHLR
jgi:hypothetical protein